MNDQLEKITELRDQWSACNRKLGELIDQARLIQGPGGKEWKPGTNVYL